MEYDVVDSYGKKVGTFIPDGGGDCSGPVTYRRKHRARILSFVILFVSVFIMMGLLTPFFVLKDGELLGYIAFGGIAILIFFFVLVFSIVMLSVINKFVKNVENKGVNPYVYSSDEQKDKHFITITNQVYYRDLEHKVVEDHIYKSVIDEKVNAWQTSVKKRSEGASKDVIAKMNLETIHIDEIIKGYIFKKYGKITKLFLNADLLLYPLLLIQILMSIFAQNSIAYYFMVSIFTFLSFALAILSIIRASTRYKDNDIEKPAKYIVICYIIGLLLSCMVFTLYDPLSHAGMLLIVAFSDALMRVSTIIMQKRNSNKKVFPQIMAFCIVAFVCFCLIIGAVLVVPPLNEMVLAYDNGDQELLKWIVLYFVISGIIGLIISIFVTVLVDKKVNKRRRK